jgi:cystathionine beta-lyase
MKYDFDRVMDRTQSESIKWIGNEEHFGEKDLLPMWVADMDFQSPAPVIQALVERAQHGFFGYPWRSPAYYDSIIGWMRKRHSWDIRREWIVNAPGVVSALDLAVHALTQPGDKIVIQPPVYFPFFSIVRNNGRQLVENRLKFENGHYRMDLQDLEKQIDARTKALILCSPHNPVGRVWTPDELAALGELCIRKDLLILSDEIHSDLILNGHKHTPLATLTEELAQRTCTLIAPSKTFNLPGLGASAVIIPNGKLRTAFNNAVENFGLQVGNVFGIVALQAAYQYGEEWLKQMLDYVEGNVAYATRFLAERIPGIKFACPEGTYLLWLDCRGLGLSHTALRDLIIKQAKVALNDGPEFGSGGEGFQRMNLACPRSILEEGLVRIERAVKSSAQY